MKKLMALLVTLMLVFSLTACGTGANDVTASEDYYGLYNTHYDTLNYVYSAFAGNSQYTCNFVDGLVENDRFGRVVPALGESWEITDNDDGTQTWTFNIREDVWWVNRDGEKIAEVTAEDWVTAAQYILTPANASEIFGLMNTFIDGAKEYYGALADGEEADFNTVGVKAVSKYVLEYTLVAPKPYFITALTYNVFYPVNADYLTEQGSLFGTDGDSILYNGAYILADDELDARISMTPNPEYWDPESVHIQNVTWYFFPGDASTDFARMKYENGEINNFTIRENDATGWEKYISGECYGDQCEGSIINPVDPRVAVEDTTYEATYYMTFNYDRTDYTSSVVPEEERDATRVAVMNKHFRQGFLYGMNRVPFSAYYTTSNPTQNLRNSYMFPKLAVDQNGVDYMEHYYAYYAEQNDMTPEDAKKKLLDGVDGMLDTDKAQEVFATAKQELIAGGLTEADFPIKVEVVFDYSPNRGPYFQEMVDGFNAMFGEEFAKIELIYPSSVDNFLDLVDHLYTYDFRIWYAGWGPDYADPVTFMNTWTVNGDVVSYGGFDTSNVDLQEEVLGAYTALVEAADAITDLDKIDERFDAFAKAEYSLIYEEAIMIPFIAWSGKEVYLSNYQPYVKMKAPYGLSEDKFKHKVILSAPLTRAERAEAKAQYEADMAAAE